MERIVVIGSGNLAAALAHALAASGNPPVQIFARNRDRGRAIADACRCLWASVPDSLAPADLYLVAVSDKAVAKVTAGLAFGDGVVAHTAGSIALDALPRTIANRAVFYPLQTFTRGREIDFGQVPILVEGSNARSLDVVRRVARTLSGTVIEVDSPRRAQLHLAAVFASNFANHMYTLAEALTREAGFDFPILRPLIVETALKAADSASPSAAQTGPAIRNDFTTKALHTELLRAKPDLQNLYTNISKSIWEISRKK